MDVPGRAAKMWDSGKSLKVNGVPYGSRTRVAAVKGRCPRPLDERDAYGERCSGYCKRIKLQNPFESVKRPTVLSFVLCALFFAPIACFVVIKTRTEHKVQRTKIKVFPFPKTNL